MSVVRTQVPRWLVGLLAAGCVGCAGPTEPPPVPSGGTEAELDFARFVQDVAPILAAQGCAAAGCHGGGIRGTYALSPAEAPDAGFDFDQTVLQVNPVDAFASPILAEPLAESAGGTPHQHEPFATADDEDYLAILAWIEAGTP